MRTIHCIIIIIIIIIAIAIAITKVFATLSDRARLPTCLSVWLLLIYPVLPIHFSIYPRARVLTRSFFFVRWSQSLDFPFRLRVVAMIWTCVFSARRVRGSVCWSGVRC